MLTGCIEGGRLQAREMANPVLKPPLYQAELHPPRRMAGFEPTTWGCLCIEGSVGWALAWKREKGSLEIVRAKTAFYH